MLKEVKKLIIRSFATKHDEKGWANFEQFLQVRTFVFMTAKNMMFVSGIFLGTEHF